MSEFDAKRAQAGANRRRYEEWRAAGRRPSSALIPENECGFVSRGGPPRLVR
jgi:hypothetical protein